MPDNEAKSKTLALIEERLRSSFGAYLPHDQAVFLLNYAKAQEARAERFLGQAREGAQSYQSLLTSCQIGLETSDKMHREHSDVLRAAIVRKTRTIRVLSALLVVAICVVAWLLHAS